MGTGDLKRNIRAIADYQRMLKGSPANLLIDRPLRVVPSLAMAPVQFATQQRASA